MEGRPPEEHRLYAFLTRAANAIVAPVHPKARLVMLVTEAEIDVWSTAPVEVALRTPAFLADVALRIVAAGER